MRLTVGLVLMLEAGIVVKGGGISMRALVETLSIHKRISAIKVDLDDWDTWQAQGVDSAAQIGSSLLASVASLHQPEGDLTMMLPCWEGYPHHGPLASHSSSPLSQVRPR
jgi:hypothetical protein